jgi:hypothetical protein
MAQRVEGISPARAHRRQPYRGQRNTHQHYWNHKKDHRISRLHIKQKAGEEACQPESRGEPATHAR